MRWGVKSFDWSVSGEDAVRMNVSTAEIIANVKRILQGFSIPLSFCMIPEEQKHTEGIAPDPRLYSSAGL